MNDHFRDGYYQAERMLARDEPRASAYWLDRARRSRRRWLTRLFDPKKRRYLDGFIACLEKYVERQRTGDEAAIPAPGYRLRRSTE